MIVPTQRPFAFDRDVDRLKRADTQPLRNDRGSKRVALPTALQEFAFSGWMCAWLPRKGTSSSGSRSMESVRLGESLEATKASPLSILSRTQQRQRKTPCPDAEAFAPCPAKGSRCPQPCKSSLSVVGCAWLPRRPETSTLAKSIKRATLCSLSRRTQPLKQHNHSATTAARKSPQRLQEFASLPRKETRLNDSLSSPEPSNVRLCSLKSVRQRRRPPQACRHTTTLQRPRLEKGRAAHSPARVRFQGWMCAWLPRKGTSSSGSRSMESVRLGESLEATKASPLSISSAQNALLLVPKASNVSASVQHAFLVPDAEARVRFQWLDVCLAPSEGDFVVRLPIHGERPAGRVARRHRLALPTALQEFAFSPSEGDFVVRLPIHGERPAGRVARSDKSIASLYPLPNPATSAQNALLLVPTQRPFAFDRDVDRLKRADTQPLRNDRGSKRVALPTALQEFAFSGWMCAWLPRKGTSSSGSRSMESVRLGESLEATKASPLSILSRTQQRQRKTLCSLSRRRGRLRSTETSTASSVQIHNHSATTAARKGSRCPQPCKSSLSVVGCVLGSLGRELRRPAPDPWRASGWASRSKRQKHRLSLSSPEPSNVSAKRFAPCPDAEAVCVRQRRRPPQACRHTTTLQRPRLEKGRAAHSAAGIRLATVGCALAPSEGDFVVQLLIHGGCLTGRVARSDRNTASFSLAP